MSQGQFATPRQDDEAISVLSLNASLQHLTLTEANAQTRLLRLLPELRNKIYYLVTVAVDQINIKDGHIENQPPLAAVCSQTRTEFRDLFLYTVPMTASLIKCRVRNYDFSSVITFIQRLDENQIQAMITNIDAGAKFKIHLTVDSDAPEHAENLARWLNFCDATVKLPDTRDTYHFLEDAFGTRVRGHRPPALGDRGRAEWDRINVAAYMYMSGDRVA